MPEFCGELALCGSDSDCDSPVACAAGECVLGVCWMRSKNDTEPDACSADLNWCHPENGCLPLGEDPLPLDSCANGIQDPTELNIDCGGSCTACSPLASRLAEDCLNGRQDEGETGVDCGGSCTPCLDDSYDCETQTDIPVHECRALVALHAEGDGISWVDSSTWLLEGSSPCDWEGIDCSEGHVDEVDRRNINVLGPLPIEFFSLSELQSFNFFKGFVTGTVPVEIARLRELTNFNLAFNNLSGTVPAAIGSLPKLESFRLDNNALEGTVPEALGQLSELKSLSLSSNNLMGTIPASFGNLSKLESLTLSNLPMTGDLPDELSNLTNLEILSLNHSRFTGEIPAWLPTLSSLSIVRLHDNRFAGTIPQGFADLSQLEELTLHENQLRGPVPEDFAELSGLSIFSLHTNHCLWAEECVSLQPWLDAADSIWQSSNTDPQCTPGPAACE